MAKEIDKIIQSKTAPKSNNVLWDDGENLKINRNGKWESTGGGAPMINITYANLVELRNNSKLIAGMQYRITDFVTTTAQENTRSAGHQFDVIVTADNENTLNEVARICRSEFDIEKYKDAFYEAWGEKMLYVGTQEYEGKEYHLYESESQNLQMLVDFNQIKAHHYEQSNSYPCCCYPSFARGCDGLSWEDWQLGSYYGESIQFKYDAPTYFATSKLEAWQIWYSLDNDAERFAWADTANGKGVIYRMIDEWNNDCPYDFKNIQFKRNLIFENGYAEYSEDGEETWVYTFAGQSYHINNDEWSDMLDGSLESPHGHMSDEGSSTFHDNIIKPYIMLYNGNDVYTECGIRYLNDIVLLGYWSEIGSENENDMPYYYAFCCYNNSFGNDCYNNSFGNSCHDNTFGNKCHHNSLGDYFIANTLGNECTGVTLDVNTNDKIASRNSYGEVKVFNLADLIS